jgi:REP element-mobilizing transposase RayT
MEKWLDRTPASRQLGVPVVARMIEEAIENRVTRGIWNMFEYVVMPSHLHLFFELLQPGLKQTLKSFKRWTGHEAAKLIPLWGPRFWQQEWFDHWSRSDAEDERIAAYIRRNPMAAGLCNDYLTWPYGSWSSCGHRSPSDALKRGRR